MDVARRGRENIEIKVLEHPGPSLDHGEIIGVAAAMASPSEYSPFKTPATVSAGAKRYYADCYLKPEIHHSLRVSTVRLTEIRIRKKGRVGKGQI